jgi:hypothetical protein
MEHDLLPELLQREAVSVVDYSGRFIDIGTPERSRATPTNFFRIHRYEPVGADPEHGERQSILDAVRCIEAGALQIAFVVADDQRLLGVVTNRRHLLQGGQTDLPVTTCMNSHYRAVQAGASREELLKAFDLGFNAIPAVDEQGRLVEVYTRLMAASPEVPVLARGRAPVRMSFCGGGADLTYFFIDHPAAVLSCTVGLCPCHPGSPGRPWHPHFLRGPGARGGLRLPGRPAGRQ